MFASCVYERRAIINLCGKMQDKTQKAKTSKHSRREKRERKKGLATKTKKKSQNHPVFFPALFFPSF